MPSVPPAAGQTVFRGQVLDQQNAPLTAVYLELVDSAGSIALSTLSDSTGAFRMHLPRGVGKGAFYISAQLLGYAPIERSVLRAGNSEDIVLLLFMSVAPTELQPVNVIARARHRHRVLDEFYDRAYFVKRTGLGHILSYDELQDKPWLNALQAVTRTGLVGSARMTRGAGLSYETPIMRGCVPTVFLNRMRISPADLEDIDPHLLEGIEIYRGFEEVPADYSVEAGTCGAILLWTAQPRPGHRLSWTALLLVGGLVGLAIIEQQQFR